MIKFFRKIRQSLLIEGNTSKYLKYALGEIVLVVLGILIALHLNNLSDLRKIHTKQENYLLLIEKEMNNNLNSLSKEQSNLTTSINSQKELLTLMHRDGILDTLNEVALSRLLVNAISASFAVNYQNGALTELISSGSLKDIENDSIRGLLSSWEGKIYKLREQEKSLRELWIKTNDYFETHGIVRTAMGQTNYWKYIELEKLFYFESNKHLLKSTIFENIFLIHLATSMHLHKNVYPKFEKDLKSLIDLINEELGAEKYK